MSSRQIVCPAPLSPPIACVVSLLLLAAGAAAAPRPAAPRAGGTDTDAVALFELRVRPLLAANCVKCHADHPRQGGLDLRGREGFLKGGAHGAAVVPGKPAASRLYRRLAGLEQPSMPPTGRLPAGDLAAVRAWIQAGAPWSGAGWWAARPVRPRPVPRLSRAWIRTPIDAFVLDRLLKEGLTPAPPATRETLIRRATFDLTGLPPTPEQVDAFLADRAPDAWEKVVDRLLASPRYGERWARHWLDLARYAESEGFKSDETRPNAWRYRDYVIRSLNEDKPYDRFVKEQIAGDELYPGDPEALVATGFNRHWADESNARDLAQRRQEILNDITDTVGSVFLGTTVGCARCHDHKYDPITHQDYYRLQAFFAASQPRDDLLLASPAEAERHARQLREWEDQTRGLRERLEALESPVRQRLVAESKEKFPADVQAAVDTPPGLRTALQWQLALKAAPQLQVAADAVGKAMKPEQRTVWETLRKELAEFDPQRPATLPVAIGITDVGREAPPTHVLAAGVYAARREEVQPGFLSALDPRAPAIGPPAGLASTGRRAALANWLASPENPLSARVMVNRVWQHHFGTGLVRTESDFGNAGQAPTHPELLDWLAWVFVQGSGVRGQGPGRTDRTDRSDRSDLPALYPQRRPWSLKALHRLILLSSTYRQSSDPHPASGRANRKSKIENRKSELLAHVPRRRLEGEAIRDAMLAVSGRLNLKMGGPSIFPELPEGQEKRPSWPVTGDAAERDRRSIYVFVRRNLRYPLFHAFDMPDTHEPCARRIATTTAPQALLLLNDASALRLAQAFAGRVLKEAGISRAAWVERAYRLAFGRAPDPEERQLALAFLERQAAVNVASGEIQPPQPDPAPPGLALGEGAALVDFCHALFNANEFVYVD